MYAHTDDRTLDDRTSNRQDYRVWPSQRLDRLKQGGVVAAAETDRTVGAAPGLDVDAGAGFDDTSVHRAEYGWWNSQRRGPPPEPEPQVLQLTEAQPAGFAQQSGGLPGWAKWVIVGGIVVVGALAINEVTGDSESPSSPF